MVGVENSNTEHTKVQGQRAKTELGKAFQNLFHTKRRSAIRRNQLAKLVPKKRKRNK